MKTVNYFILFLLAGIALNLQAQKTAEFNYDITQSSYSYITSSQFQQKYSDTIYLTPQNIKNDLPISAYMLDSIISYKTLDGKGKKETTEWKYRYSYDIEGRVCNEEKFLFIEEKWVPSISKYWTWDSNGNLLEQSNYVYDTDLGDYKIQLQVKCRYDNQSNELIFHECINHLPKVNEIPMYKKEVDYFKEDGVNYKRVTLVFDDLQDSFFVKEVYTYSMDDVLKSYFIQAPEQNQKQITFEYKDACCVKELHKVKNDADEWVDFEKQERSFEGDCCVNNTIYNIKNMEWEISSIHTFLYDESNKKVVKWEKKGVAVPKSSEILYEYKDGLIAKVEYFDGANKTLNKTRIWHYDASNRCERYHYNEVFDSKVNYTEEWKYDFDNVEVYHKIKDGNAITWDMAKDFTKEGDGLRLDGFENNDCTVGDQYIEIHSHGSLNYNEISFNIENCISPYHCFNHSVLSKSYYLPDEMVIEYYKCSDVLDTGMKRNKYYYTYTLGVDEAQNAHNTTYSISPNPTKGVITINSDNLYMSVQNRVKVELVNSEGKLCKSFQYNPGMGVNIEEYPKGLYFLKFKSNEGVQTEKVILN
ncbi:MAG: T9SS type A sorting domain-containing protein [Bacteroidales bacterium]